MDSRCPSSIEQVRLAPHHFAWRLNVGDDDLGDRSSRRRPAPITQLRPQAAIGRTCEPLAHHPLSGTSYWLICHGQRMIFLDARTSTPCR